MSYILDALQKSQAEQAADGLELRVQQSQARRSVHVWLLWLLVIVLLLNAGLLAWAFLLREPSETAAQAASATQRNPPPPASLPEPVEAAPVAPRTPVETAAAAPPRAANTLAEAIPPRDKLPAAQTPRLALRELPTAEQSLYNGFVYSTHIYTDDQSLCAIVIDGQRLQAGDAFKGLKVTAITEQGVVFEENRRGVVREIEVNLQEQWDG